jgi:hypothetical protein
MIHYLFIIRLNIQADYTINLLLFTITLLDMILFRPKAIVMIPSNFSRPSLPFSTEHHQLKIILQWKSWPAAVAYLLERLSLTRIMQLNLMLGHSH